eukprot:jgi/Botrbrau1/1869/Bobra.146_1s0056.1
MADEPIPEHVELGSVYPTGSDEAVHRYETLKNAFKARFGEIPELYSRSPGRVNLIGEHIDYEGYGVLPMAIKQDTIVAIRTAGNKLIITNVDKEKYPEATFDLDPSQSVDTKHHHWGNYVLAAYKGVFEYLASKNIEATPVGLEMMVDGVVPLGSGLSSSAALVCASSIAILASLGVQLTKGDIATFTAKCEKYVGTESGGMDQAISVMGQTGVAKMIEFNPVRASDVVLPEGASFVIAHSLAVNKKAETADRQYNLRVVECRLASVVLGIKLGVPKEEALKLQTLKDVEPIALEKVKGPKGDVANALTAAIEEHLHEEPYSQAELEALFGETLEQFFVGSASQLRAVHVASTLGGFKLRQRALHVISEAARVPEFREVCNGSLPPEEKLTRLGKLMDESQASCRDLYECSCPELDELVSIAKNAGALGARLTGAGWGGCTVSLVHDADVDNFISALRTKYFGPKVDQGVITSDGLPEVVFASKPSSGGAVIRLPA